MKNEQAPRERILATAIRLFNEVGVHTTGIDRIIEESGVAKKTFYHHCRFNQPQHSLRPLQKLNRKFFLTKKCCDFCKAMSAVEKP